MKNFVSLIFMMCFIVNKMNCCPEKCKCDSEFTVIDCSFKALTKEPIFPYSSQSINISNNHIEYLHLHSFKNLQNLKEIYISDNQLTNVDNELFINNLKLTIVNLKNNKIEIMSFKIFNVENRLTSLDISNNAIEDIIYDNYLFYYLINLDLSNNKLNQFSFTMFQSGFKSLEILNLSFNKITSVYLRYGIDKLTSLNLDSNEIENFSIDDIAVFPNLIYLNIANNKLNKLNSKTFNNLKNLQILIISNNPISHFTSGIFEFLKNLIYLNMDGLALENMNYRLLEGLSSLKTLSVNNNHKLSTIELNSFSSLKNLTTLSLINNSLNYFDANIFSNLPILTKLHVSGNKFVCDCRFKLAMFQLHELVKSKALEIDEVLCSFPQSKRGTSALSLDYLSIKCSKLTNVIGEHDNEVLSIDEMSALMNDQVTIPCTLIQIIPVNNFVWFKRGRNNDIYHYTVNNTDVKHLVNENGSLQISTINRSDLGYYYCRGLSTKSNRSSIMLLSLDVQYMYNIELYSLFWALMSVVFFCCVAILVVLLRLCFNSCSQKERKKRKSIHEVLHAIRSSIHMDKLLLYRSTQLERISAFRSATLDHLSSFKSARVDDIRRYKHATVNTVLHCLERMRLHYTAQTARIKDHCNNQVEKLRSNYIQQCSRLKDRKSLKFKKIQKKYNKQALRIKDYSTAQMSRLHDQYKQQQQHLIKLLELLEIGNCVNVIETDCSHAESIIFDTQLNLSFSDYDEECDGLFASSHTHPLSAESSSLLHREEDEDDDDDDEDDDCMGAEFSISMEDLELVEVELFKEEEWNNIATEISSILAEEGSGATSQTAEELRQNLAEARKNFFLAESSSSKKI